MSRMVQVAVAGDAAEAKAIQEMLVEAGIDAELSAGDDDPLVVLVPDASLEAAQDAIDAMAESEDGLEA